MSSTTHAYSQENELDFYETPTWATLALLRALGRDGYRLADASILDPFAGRGAILRAAHEALPLAMVRGIELDPARAKLASAIAPTWQRDAMGDIRPWTDEGHAQERFRAPPNLILTNPPYNSTMACVQRTLSESWRPKGRPALVAHLLAMQFLSSADRADFHLKFPSRIYVLSRRPSFCATLKCKNSGGKRTGPAACTFKRQQPLEDERPKACPVCGGKVDVTTNDSATYAWFVWNVLPMHQHTWTVIPTEECR
jgi:hypothetical protein